MHEKHREFLEKLGDLMYEYGFNTVYSNDGEIVFDDDEEIEGDNWIAFKSLHKGSFLDITSTKSIRTEQYDKRYDFCER